MDFLGNKKGNNNHNSSKKDDDYEIVWSAPTPTVAQPTPVKPVQTSSVSQTSAPLSSHFFSRVAEKQKDKQELKNGNHNPKPYTEPQIQQPKIVASQTEIVRSTPLPSEKPAVDPANFLAENLAEAKKEGFVRPEFDLNNKNSESLTQKIIKTESTVQRLEKNFGQYVKNFFSNLFFANPKIHSLPQAKKVEKTAGEEINNPKILEANLIKRETGLIFNLGRKIIWPVLGILMPVLIIGMAYFVLHLQINKKQTEITQTSDQISSAQAQAIKAESEAEPALLFKKRLAVVNSLLNKHVYWTNFFRWLEANTLLEVSYLNGFSGDLSGKYDLVARAQNYVLIERQVAQLAGAPETNSASVKSAKTAVAVKDAVPNVEFNLNLEVKPEIFYKP